MSTCTFGTCQKCGKVQYMQGPCECGGRCQQGGMKPKAESAAMTNKPMLSVERDLLEELQWHYKPYDDHYHKESGYYCPMCGSEKSQGHDATCEIKAVFDNPAAQHQGEPVGEVADMKYNRVRFYRATGDTTKPYLQPGTKIYVEQPGPVATVAKLMQAIHDVEGFPGVTGDQLRELAARLNGEKP